MDWKLARDARCLVILGTKPSTGVERRVGGTILSGEHRGRVRVHLDGESRSRVVPSRYVREPEAERRTEVPESTGPGKEEARKAFLSRNRPKAKRRAVRSGPDHYLKLGCPTCKKAMLASRLLEHCQRTHGPSAVPTTAMCTVCEHEYRLTGLVAHYRRRHAIEGRVFPLDAHYCGHCRGVFSEKEFGVHVCRLISQEPPLFQGGAPGLGKRS